MATQTPSRAALKTEPSTLRAHLLLEPAHGFLLADAVLEPNTAHFPLLVCNAEAWSAQDLYQAAITGNRFTTITLGYNPNKTK